MPYTAEISRQNPGCILFLIDQSASMEDPFAGETGRSKADKLADAINRLLYELVIRCTKDQAEGIRDYYEVGVIGYGNKVGSAWGGELEGKTLVSISEAGNKPAQVESRTRKVEDGTGGIIEETVKFAVWFYPVADGGTPMCQALNTARSVLDPWIAEHAASFPPIVINITDGDSTDGNPTGPAETLRGLSTDDGDLLLFNLHLSDSDGAPVTYPENEEALSDNLARQLFNMSSVLPAHIQDAARGEGYEAGAQSRGFVFNADIVEVIKFLDIGTRARELR